MIYFAQSSQNQTDLIVKEAERAGAERVKATASGVQFSGSLEVGYRFCLTTRIASRVLQALYFDEHISSPDELYEKCKLIPWEEYIDPSKTFQLTQTVQACNWIKNSHFASLRVKDAIVDRIREHFNEERPSVDTDNPDITFHLHIKSEKVIIYIDFSGEGLFKRGYRSDSTDAILKEHLAAAVLYRSDWYKTVLDSNPGVFLDPFCGSGTLVVEAALLARDIAPGLIRKQPYAFEKLSSFDAEIYEKVLSELSERAEEAKNREIKIYASDISRTAVEIAKAAALKAGVYDEITFSVKDFTLFTSEDVPSSKGYIVTDPPYGIRMKDFDESKLYSKLGAVCQENFKGWKISILCGDSELLSLIDMKPERTNSLFNGGILCQLAHYSVFSDEEKQELIQRAIKRREERLAQPLSEGAQMAY
ncbi:THUMP domain-containing class I SAM-dependent RNA methyltransferase, partial [Bullifex porci]|uniref:THUMP domain-containing class I SAM-dependent RNA methyltransferase n=1 Tax=Bullifex porci TaxID=2606638 RepID=UPI0023F20B4C